MSFNFENKDKNKHKNIKYAPSRRYSAKWQWYLLSFIIISPFIYFAWNFTKSKIFTIADGHVIFDKISIISPNNGYVTDITVKPGDLIKSNGVLIKIEKPEAEKELKALKYKLELLQNIVKNTPNPSITHQIKMKKEAEDYLAMTLYYYNKILSLKDRNVISLNDFQKTREILNNAKIQLYEINCNISEKELKHKFNLENQYGQRIWNIEMELSRIEAILDVLNINSPINGTVESIYVNKFEYVVTGQRLMDISTNKNLGIKAYLSSKEMSEKILIGRKVSVVFSWNCKIKGIISKSPNLAEGESKKINIIKEDPNKVIIIIKLETEPPEQYKIYGFPVKVYF